MEIFINLIITLLVSALVIWIVGRLGLGLSVSSFGNAFIAAIVIAIVSAVITWLIGALGLTLGSGLIGFILNLIVAAIILMVSDRFLPGFTVSGFGGALIAAIAIAVVSWLVNWLLATLGLF